MNSFFKGLIRGLLAIIPICLIVCVLFAGQRLILTDIRILPQCWF